MALRRIGVVLAGMLLVGGTMSGAAFAQTDDTTAGGLTDIVTTDAGTGGGSTDTTTDGGTDTTTDGGTTALTGAAEALTEGLTDGGEALTEALTDGQEALTEALTDLATTAGGTTSSTPSGPSGSNTQIIYSPYPFPVYGDFGNRYYGKYRDNGCGCDRYAAPTYKAPNYVATTQVASVPKGGVDTGDGSFQ